MSDYLTLVFSQPLSPATRALLESGEWSAASHSHAIHDRDRIDGIASDLQETCDRQAQRIAELEKQLHCEQSISFRNQLQEVTEQRDELLAALEAGRRLIELISPFEGDETRQMDKAIARVKGETK